MEATRPGPLGKARQITGRERDKIRAELREGYLAGATIRDLVEQTGRSFGFVRTLLCEAGVVPRGRGGDRTRRRCGEGLHNTDLFDWIALRRADTGSVSIVGRSYFDNGRKAPCYLPAAFARLVEAGFLELVEHHPAGHRAAGCSGAVRRFHLDEWRSSFRRRAASTRAARPVRRPEGRAPSWRAWRRTKGIRTRWRGCTSWTTSPPGCAATPRTCGSLPGRTSAARPVRPRRHRCSPEDRPPVRQRVRRSGRLPALVPRPGQGRQVSRLGDVRRGHLRHRSRAGPRVGGDPLQRSVSDRLPGRCHPAYVWWIRR